MRRDQLPEGPLGELLSAAAAPGRPHELRGEEEAVAQFRQQYQPGPAVAPVRQKRPVRRLVAVAALALAAVGAGGTAFAAHTGHLPDRVQSWFDDSDAPAPPPVHTTAAAPSSPLPLPSLSPKASPGAATTTADLCRAWVARRTDPHARPVTGDDRKVLSQQAGGEPAIDGYCDRLLGITPTPATTSPKPKGHEKSKETGNDKKNSGGVTPSG
ncbi:hypothetical protein [Dactylosporangium sp. CA-233914]|uniref:hypothetical protein n=1 Tax=Dactylosporangium sp. CA-233914 TaxID=3239934 RepID=UPI003D91961B